LWILLSAGANNTSGPFSYLLLAKIKLNELPPVADNVPLDGPGLTEMVNAIVVQRGPLKVDEVSTDETDAIDTATGYKYGIMVKSTENPSVDECLKRVLVSCTADRYFDGSGTMRVFRLTAPEAVADSDVAFTLDHSRGDFLSELIVYPDLAENLTSRAKGCPNGDPMTDGDFGSTSLTDCNNATRAKLKADFQIIQSAGIPLRQRYIKAYRREPIATCLDRAADIADMIRQANGLYTDDRNFYVGDVWMPFTRRRWNGSAWVDVSGDFQVGQCFKVTYPVGTLRTGQKLWLLGYSPKQPSIEKCKCIFWGL